MTMQNNQDVEQLIPILDILVEGVLLVDASSSIRYTNSACEHLFGYYPGELLGQPMSVLLHRESRGPHHEYVEAYHQDGDIPKSMSKRPVLPALRKNGEPIQVSVSLCNVTLANQRYSAAVISDAHMIGSAERNLLREIAEKDVLTGLMNRAFLSKTIHHFIETQSRFTLLFMDLNKFKPINDTYGHEAGDFILQQVAERLRLHVRAGDCVARLGGDEFVMALQNLSETGRIQQICQELYNCIAEPISFKGQQHQVGASIGIAIYPEDGSSEIELLRAADTAMYQAKNSGRRCAFFKMLDLPVDGLTDGHGLR